MKLMPLCILPLVHRCGCLLDRQEGKDAEALVAEYQTQHNLLNTILRIAGYALRLNGMMLFNTASDEIKSRRQPWDTTSCTHESEWMSASMMDRSIASPKTDPKQTQPRTRDTPT